MNSPDFSLSGRKNDYPNIPVSNGDAFWPSLNVGEFKRMRSLNASIPNDTLGHALLASMAEINLILKPVVEYWTARQVTTANDTPGGKMGDETQLAAQYKKAVYARAKADLMGEFAINGRRDTHPALGDNETQNRLLGESAAVIRNMLQLPRVGVYRL